MTCLAPHKDRIATLKSLFTCVGFSSLISSLSLPTLRGLRTLSLELTDTCAIVDPTVISLCLEQCSHIRALEMVNLAVSFEFPQPMNLVKFSLSTVQDLPSLVTITSLFRESPNLEVVSLDKYSGISLPRSPREGPADTVTGPPVSMPNLRILSIHAPTRYTRNLLSALSCPQARLQVTLLPVCLHRAVASGFIVSAFPAALKQLDAVDSLLVNLDTLRSDATIVGFNTFAVESLATIQDLMADSSDAPYVFRLTISKGRMPALATSVFHSCVVKALRKFVGSSVLAKKVTRLVMYLPEDPSSLLMGKLVRSLPSLKSVEVI
ncbi:hypothetical protein EUX98_g4536 [Antrodiella citrinella]|uniref:F-box domain-containing protein n=1 Tax=Antrodiella citrinella TaxID=2447956 RepID=A0A4S4N1Q4_9APHY|nr:hypothetical protein EUX98_g4536 [Antrodiella citrinella]